MEHDYRSCTASCRTSARDPRGKSAEAVPRPGEGVPLHRQARQRRYHQERATRVAVHLHAPDDER